MQTGRADLDAMLKVSTIPADEPVFIGRAQDADAAEMTRAWAALHLARGGSKANAEAALRQAEAMEAWPVKKVPGDDHWTADERKQLEYAFSQRAWRARGDDSDLRIALAVQRGYAQAHGQLSVALAGQLPFKAIDCAHRDGTAYLGFGIHDRVPDDAQRGVKPGDYWFGVILWDIWREPSQWVFSKDGEPVWSEPLAYFELTPPANLDHLLELHDRRGAADKSESAA
jgi:hypothetical protein